MAKNPIKSSDYKVLKTKLSLDFKNKKITIKKYDKLNKIFTFLFYSGARISEVLRLKGMDISYLIENKELRLLTPKTKKYKDGGFRDIPFTDTAIEDIADTFKDCIKHQEGYCLCPHTNRSKMLNLNTVVKEITSYLNDTFGKGKFTSHSFRAGIITEMILDHEVNSKVVQSFIGHKNEATTMIYVKPTKTDIRNALIR